LARAAGAALTGVLALLLAAPVAAAPGGDPVAEADRAVAEAQGAADAAADSYFEQLARFESLGVEIAATEERLVELDARADELRATVQERAAHAYRRSGDTDVELGFRDEEDAMSSARRTVLLDGLNEQDNDAAAALADVTESLEAKREQLSADRGQQEQVLADLKAEQVALDAMLAEAQARRNEAVAQQQAAAAAAAAAATARPPAAGQPGVAARPGAAPQPQPQPSPSPSPSQPAPPPYYAPAPGQHPQHNHPFLVCTRAIESGGNYQAYNASGPYYGAYQFLRSTWNSTANHAGRYELIGVVPSQASPYDQDDMAWVLYNWQGKRPWGGRC
jgi:hypothetical protein